MIKLTEGRGDWEFVEVCTAEGITGTSMKHREGFKRMVVDALAGKIDLIVTKSVNKLISQKDAIKDKQSRQATIEAYLETLKSQGTLVERFESAFWCALLDFVTVYSKKDVRFTFKDGTEMGIKAKNNSHFHISILFPFFSIAAQTGARQPA